MEYGGNAKKDRPENKIEKKVERVIASEVIVQKKSLGRKFRDMFIEADFKSVVKYVISDVLLPAVRNTIVDASTKGIERMMYGDSAMRRRNYGPGPRVTYNNPINRGYRDSAPSRYAPSISSGPRSRHSNENFILSTREEAELVLERMIDIIDKFEIVSMADLNELVGFPVNHIDNKWGWSYLSDVPIRQIREGYLIDLPPAEPI